MIVTTWGTRGSLPVCAPSKARYGGNTTCLQIESDCLPAGMVLCVDAGTGFLPMCWKALKGGMGSLTVLQTHYHHDHTQGMLIAPPIYIGNIPIKIFGPVESGVGPGQAYAQIMKPPWHPVPLEAISGHVDFQDIKAPDKEVIVFSRTAGVHKMSARKFESAKRARGKLALGREEVPTSACLVVTMQYTDHPQRTVCYRFREGSSGKTFVFLTDEEARASTPRSLVDFLRGCDLLIQDSQYSEEIHRTRTAGFGHGTPPYAANMAKAASVRRMGLTHHDPSSTDDDIDRLVADAKKAVGRFKIRVFACRDYQRIEV